MYGIVLVYHGCILHRKIIIIARKRCLKAVMPKYLNKAFYKKIFFTIVLLITLVIFVLSITLYFNFENIVISQTTVFIKENLSKVSYSATFMSESANILLTQLYKDNLIQNFFHNISSDELGLYLSNIRLRSFRNLVPYVKSIYIYNGSTKKIYYDTDTRVISGNEINSFFDADIFNITKDKEIGKPNTPIPRVVKSNYSFNKSYNVYTYILYDMPIEHSDKDNFFVVNISEDWLKRIINSLDSKQQGTIFIINEDGQMVSSIEDTPFLTDISDKNYVKKILSSRDSSGYFVDTVDGIKCLVTFVSLDDKTSWKFIHVMPYHIITDSVKGLKANTVIISGIIILLGLSISFFTSLKLYKPIDIVLQNLEKLKAESQKTKNVLKENFLRTLIKSGFPQNHKWDEYDFNIDASNHFLVILLMIDNYSDFYSQYGYNDRVLFKSAITKTINKLCAVNFKSECVDMDNDHIVLLLNVDCDFDHIDKVKKLIEHIQDVVKNDLGLSLSAVLDAYPSKLDNVCSLYKELIDVSHMRLFYGHNCIIFLDKIQLKDSSEYVYMDQKEKILSECLLLRDIDKAKDAFNEIIESVQGYSSIIVSMVLHRLTLLINTEMEKIKRRNNINMPYNLIEFNSKLYRMDTIDKIKEHFYNAFEDLINVLEAIQKDSNNYIANKIEEIIKTNYADQNICTNSLASMLGMSSDYIGRLFRNAKSISIAEYINKVRIEKAKELLESTNKSINEIMDQIGFSNNSYFYILFKKYNGVTPSEYRKRSRVS